MVGAALPNDDPNWLMNLDAKLLVTACVVTFSTHCLAPGGSRLSACARIKGRSGG